MSIPSGQLERIKARSIPPEQLERLKEVAKTEEMKIILRELVRAAEELYEREKEVKGLELLCERLEKRTAAYRYLVQVLEENPIEALMRGDYPELASNSDVN